MKWLAMLVAVLTAKEGIALANNLQLKEQGKDPTPPTGSNNLDNGRLAKADATAEDSKATKATTSQTKAKTTNKQFKNPYPDQAQLFVSNNEKETSFFLPLSQNLILDPAYATDSESTNILSNLYEPLVYFDVNNKPVAGVAKSYQVSKDGKQWIFRLRKDARWSDGSPVTAYDFVYAWRRLVDPAMQSPNRFIMQQANILNAEAIISGEQPADQLGIIALNDHELLIVLEKPTPWLLSFLGTTATAPLKVATYFKPGEEQVNSTEIISNGPYKFEPDDQSRFVLTQNEFYADRDRLHIEKIYGYQEVPFNGEIASTNLNVFYVNNHDVETVAEQYQNQLVTKIFPEAKFLEINMEDRHMSKKNVREAINLLIDRRALSRDIFDTTVPTTVLTPPVVLESGQVEQNEELLHNVDANIERALKLLKQARYTEKNPLRLKFVYSLDTSDENTFAYYNVLINQLNQNSNGIIQVDAVGLTNAEYFRALRTGDYQITAISWTATYNHASTFYKILSSDSGDNFAHYSNFQYDELINEAHNESDSARRTELFAQANEIINKDLPIIPLLWKAEFALTDPRLKNFNSNTFSTVVKNMYFDDTGYEDLVAMFDKKSHVKVQLAGANKPQQPEQTKVANMNQVNTFVFTVDSIVEQVDQTLVSAQTGNGDFVQVKK